MTTYTARLLICGALAFWSADATAADPQFASPSSRASVSAMRLLSAGSAQGGVYRAGVEITLDPHTVTYWRQPGEAGSPPTFDFTQSTNVAKVEIGYPVPKHIDEAGTIVAGYDKTVVFPLKVTPLDAKAPVTLRLQLDYAACGKICLPAKGAATLPLPQSGASPFAQTIADAEAATPVRISAAEAKKRLKSTASGDGVWRLSVSGADKTLDVFPEVAEPLFIDSKRTGDDFELTLFATGAKPKSADATITVVTDKGAYEAPTRLE
jgi:DsbC/DsbD-like thiol-disulfide interchange protein